MAELPLLQDPDAVDLCGTVERIVFHNEENGYTVLRLIPDKGQTVQGKVRGAPSRSVSREPVTCVGHMINPQAGAHLRLQGRRVNNPRFGRQIAFDAAEEVMPATTEGIRLYLASGLIKGVGEQMAGRIVAAFGTDTIRVLDEEPERLLKIRGVGRKNFERICTSWAEHRGMRELLLFLQPHGITPTYAVRIYRAYGNAALAVVRENQKAVDDGHVFLPHSRLTEEVCRQLGVVPELVQDALTALELDERLVREPLDTDEYLSEEKDDTERTAIYLRRFHHYESKTAFYLHRILASPKSVHFEKPAAMVEKVAADLPLALAPEQLEAVHTAARSKIMVLTGGPGTGKTTIIKAIIQLFSQNRTRILLAAPTGRAAKRMAESTGREARTIHRLLEYSPKEDGFARNENTPLACGLLVVDEASMMDVMLFYHLLKAVPLGATVVLVGDVHQLPSVGPGAVLADIIESGVVPVVRLTEIFRQSAESEIICNAHLINRGEVPLLESSRERLSDFYFIRQNEPEKAAELMVDLVRNHIPRRFGLNPVDDIQVLTPMLKGAVGAASMNALLQEALNPNGLEVRRGERAFRLHDKVMQIRNNYDKDVFNGDMGRIVHLDPRERTLSVSFDERVVPYGFDELDELAPAYAISIHKSQGSEYPAVVIPIMMQHYMLLQRNLVYTGVTRGKKLVVLVGESRALHMAVKNNRTRKRHTRLARRLNPSV